MVGVALGIGGVSCSAVGGGSAASCKGFSEVARLRGVEEARGACFFVTAGGERIEQIRVLEDDKGLMRLLGRKFPSPDALLDFLHLFHDEQAWECKPEEEIAWVPPESKGLRGLAMVNKELVRRAADSKEGVATIDHDGTIIESHKQSARIAYEGTRGYQPLLAVWAEQDLIVSDEFRDGNVPAGKDPLSSVKEAFGAFPPSVTRRYFRGDSADYNAPLLKYLVEEGIEFTISADMTKQLHACCSSLPEESWIGFEERAHENVYVAEVEFFPGDWPKGSNPLRYVGLRFKPKQLQIVGEPRPTKYLAVVSNRWDMRVEELERWHWGKAGTIEHVHRVLKDELGGGGYCLKDLSMPGPSA